MQTVYDVQQILKRFGIYIYTGDRLGDLELMEMEMKELYLAEFLPIKQYHMAKIILRREAALIREESENKS
ncbi:YqgQ family protein [Virgibacillus alimentarius]|uniref:Uncharacterized protein YqgQ n=1 Tax=Virgibacillus alimentarius TaxID=698769 RepID=A0ABS4S4V6_9BACI|nr:MULTISPECIES: YqgQ family protein [Virgibacillus]MBP2256508.1 uncharacterized protein YqgQ [Virgibacillus alimentarius]HLR66454.1 YqgQ family protein [Virgibacillus sp.]